MSQLHDLVNYFMLGLRRGEILLLLSMMNENVIGTCKEDSKIHVAIQRKESVLLPLKLALFVTDQLEACESECREA